MTMERDLTREEYRSLVEQAPIMIWRSGPDKKCDYFNERWLQFTGRTMAQELGDGWAEGVHADDLGRCLEIYISSFEGKRVFEMEYRLKRHDGVYRWIFDRGVPFYDDSGAFRGYIGSCIDVTDRVVAQEAMRKAQEAEVGQLRRLLPICTFCKKVRDDDGYWRELAEYLGKHSNTDVSHGLCDECLKKHYPTYENHMGK